MADIAKNVSTILNIELSEENDVQETLPIEIESIDCDSDKMSDYEATRANLYELLHKNQKALENILEVARQTDAPRAYEVVGQFVKQQAEINKDIMDLHVKMKDMESENSSPTSVTNALYIGSTAELQKLIKSSTAVSIFPTFKL